MVCRKTVADCKNVLLLSPPVNAVLKHIVLPLTYHRAECLERFLKQKKKDDLILTNNNILDRIDFLHTANGVECKLGNKMPKIQFQIFILLQHTDKFTRFLPAKEKLVA